MVSERLDQRLGHKKSGFFMLSYRFLRFFYRKKFRFIFLVTSYYLFEIIYYIIVF